MTEKVLLYTNYPTDLQLAKYLQEHNFELFSIIDVPDLLKKTFEEMLLLYYSSDHLLKFI